MLRVWSSLYFVVEDDAAALTQCQTIELQDTLTPQKSMNDCKGQNFQSKTLTLRHTLLHPNRPDELAVGFW